MNVFGGAWPSFHDAVRFAADRLDEEGLAYIWPMFDPKAVMNDPNGFLQRLRGEGY